MKILIALDDSPHSERALDFVTRMRWPAGSRVIVTSVHQPSPSAIATAYDAPAVLPDVFEEERKQLQTVVSAAERRLREAGLPTEGRIADGDPRAALVDLARTERVDLIVLGSHGRTGLARWMLGSVSSHVVTHAPCSVIVVKEKGAESAAPPDKGKEPSR